MVLKTQEDSFLKAIDDQPYDSTTRLIYADWLEEKGDSESAAMQRWVGDMLRGRAKYDLVMTRRGILIPASSQAADLRTQTRNYWERVTAELFAQRADVAFIIISSEPKTALGLTTQRVSKRKEKDVLPSPVLYYRRNWKPWGGAKNKIFPRVTRMKRPVDRKKKRSR
jgi:uncharacterized protein (TIGR02996 family)